MRRVFLRMAKPLAADGLLNQADDIFIATFDEIRGLSQSARLQPDACLEAWQAIAARRAAFERLQREFELAPHLTYSAFLRGNRPLESASEEETGHWRGVPVSPGLVRGRARMVLTPGQFDRIAPGDILVADVPFGMNGFYCPCNSFNWASANPCQ